ncbi:MAG: spermidine synthase [Proteobacteria bacterium]|nr:MAG: spermidine synthase [Pseudomonadota bacterium]
MDEAAPASAPAPGEGGGGEDAPSLTLGPARRAVLLGSVLLVAACGLAYEIIAGAVGTYLLGDGVLQFSLTIGVFLSAMGLGSFLSRFVRRRLLATFLVMEILVGVIGASMAPLLLWVYASGGPYTVVLTGLLGGVGILSGMEIPVLLRVFKHHDTLRRSASSILGLDYVGALIGSLLVPILLLPAVGTIGASALFGLLNLAVAAVGVFTFGEVFRRRGVVLAVIAVCAAPMAAGLLMSDRLGRLIEEDLYQDPVVYARTTPFQRIVLTRWRGDLRLFLNGSLQFSSRDEYRYHEALVHPAMAVAPRRGRVLVLGGGDGLATREVLKWQDVERVDLVDLDPGVTELAASHPDLVRLNQGAFLDPRVHIANGDALKFLEAARDRWDVILMDLPDPSSPNLARLYARSTFRLALSRLTPDGVLTTQATSPFFAREAFWCIASTLDGLPVGGRGGPPAQVRPYRVTVPSFGLWGFALARARPFDASALTFPVATRWLSPATLEAALVFAPDEAPSEADRACVNRLDDPVVARAYRRGWSRYGE